MSKTKVLHSKNIYACLMIITNSNGELSIPINWLILFYNSDEDLDDAIKFLQLFGDEVDF